MLSFALVAILLDIVPVDVNQKVESVHELTDKKNDGPEEEEDTKISENLASCSFVHLFVLAGFYIPSLAVRALTFLRLDLRIELVA